MLRLPNASPIQSHHKATKVCPRWDYIALSNTLRADGRDKSLISSPNTSNQNGTEPVTVIYRAHSAPHSRTLHRFFGGICCRGRRLTCDRSSDPGRHVTPEGDGVQEAAYRDEMTNKSSERAQLTGEVRIGINCAMPVNL